MDAMRHALLDHPLTKGVASLLIAVVFVFFPVVVDAIRARRSAAPIRITVPREPRDTAVDARACQSADSARGAPPCR